MDEVEVVKLTNPHAAAPGTLYVVLGGDEPGVYQPRPIDVACGLHVDPLPIVVACTNAKDAFKIDYLNTEVFSQLSDPDDTDQILGALQSSRIVTRIFLAGERIYAFRVGSETGIYAGIPWKDLQHLTKFKNSQYKGCDTFLDALVYMLDKAHLRNEHISIHRPLSSAIRPPPRQASPVKETSRARSPAKRVSSRAASPIKHEISPEPSPTRATTSYYPEVPSQAKIPPPVMSPSKRSNTPRPEVVARTMSLPEGYKSSRGFPLVSASSARRPLGVPRPSATVYAPPAHDAYQQSASARFPTSLAARRGPDVDETFVEHLDHMHLDSSGREAGLTIEILQRLIRPPPQMLTEDEALLPPLNLGPEVDRWLANRNKEPGVVLYYMQAFLWAPAISDFVRLVGRPGPTELRPVDAEYLWSLLTSWLDDEAP